MRNALTSFLGQIAATAPRVINCGDLEPSDPHRAHRYEPPYITRAVVVGAADARSKQTTEKLRIAYAPM
jgi:hypothetical protein